MRFRIRLNKKLREIETQTQEMGKQIEQKTMNTVTQKFESVFIQFGDIFNKGIIEPILTLFKGIGIFLNRFLIY